jgi:MinD-like ATPase involved in chromosome partitioning or flagellar assembly
MKGKVIGIMSFKGGVGKSVSTINLAAALFRLGKKVLIVDGNFLSPSLHFYLGLLKPKKTLKEVVRGNIGIDDAIYEHKSGIHLLPCNFYKGINLEKFKKVVDNLRYRYDFVIIDSGPSYTDEIIAILMVCDELVFIATPDYPTLAATVKAAKIAKYKDVKIRGIILNRRKKRSLELSVRDVEKTVMLPVIAKIPEDVKLTKSVLKFMPVVGNKWSKSGRAYLKLAEKFI